MIVASHITKIYRLYESPASRLRERLWGARWRAPRQYTALDDVSIEVHKGETFGVIGRNGAGKSTLLQIIAGVLKPTTGNVMVKGRVTALLELGSGFNPDYNGRENIVLSGQILGISETEMRRRLEVIVRFAELEEFIDQPVRTYSTGMLMRLAFAAAIHVDPEVLIVDEALSVGDVYFQRKSLDRMDYFRQAGKTVLFVSHDPGLVQRFCDRVLWLEGGRPAMMGPAREVVTAYQAFCVRLEEERLRMAANTTAPRPREQDHILRELRLTGSRWGNGRIRVQRVEMVNEQDGSAWVIQSGRSVTVRLLVESDGYYPGAVFALDIYRYDGIFIGSVNNFDISPTALPIHPGLSTVEVLIRSIVLPYSVYYLSIKVYTESGAPDWRDPADLHHQMYQFNVLTEQHINGLIRLESDWRQLPALSS